MTTPESIRIVVVGDDEVGKSSLISSLIKETTVIDRQLHNNNVLPPITISRDDYYESIQEYSSINEVPTNTNRRKNNNHHHLHHSKKKILDFQDVSSEILSRYIPNITTIIDTSSSDMNTLQQELKRADVIWLVYCDHYTYERISLHWMPLFRSLGVNLPIILCANKSDLISSKKKFIKSQNSEEFIPLINEFKEIEAGVRCSAKNNHNVVECFYLCQRTVTHPISPVFDSKERELKPGAMSALKRIFFLSDTDQDGYLNFAEFLKLHKKVFDKDAKVEEFNEIVAKVDEEILPGYSNGENEPLVISENGFIKLNKIYAEMGRHETIWCILRAFNYTNSLSLSDKFLSPKVDINPNSSVELSPTGYKFFVDLFIKFDKDNDGGLNELELQNLFRPTPGIPKLWVDTQFPQSIVCNEEGFVTLQGWLAQWNLTTFLDYKTTLEYLAYLGFEMDSIKAIKVTKPRKTRQKQGKFIRNSITDRNIFNCFIVGAPRAGKTSLLETFLHNSYSEFYSPTIQPRMVVKDIELRGGKQCYLILEELGELEPAILENKSRLDQCDIMCYVYDSSDPESFQYLVDLRKKHGAKLDEIPSVFVALKADLDKQQQRSDVLPENYTRDLFLNSPLHVSLNWNSSLHELFIQLVDAAKNPATSTPGLKLESNVEQEDMKHLIMAGTTIGVMVLVSVWVLSSLRKR
ncbi:Mitochondrial Rho GTPase 1 [Candida viswanathii]|uniref:Mitochondrial Rho GTPase n=1 Tax=Candida viswanathii TaxID=5486 RepID=A0A367XR20_9ASCO|nr:Mitochondrial Rho GTPase 1 [Candida viswanathii]